MADAPMLRVGFTNVHEHETDRPMGDWIGEGTTVDDAWEQVHAMISVKLGFDATLTYDDWCAV